MKAQSGAFVEKSRRLLEQADTMFSVDLFEGAGRTAYLAGYHAAQALIFERQDRVLKTHSGVHGEFARLVKDNNHIDAELRAFLGRAYQLKVSADYVTGPDAEATPARALEAIAGARRFLAAIEQLLRA